MFSAGSRPDVSDTVDNAATAQARQDLLAGRRRRLWRREPASFDDQVYYKGQADEEADDLFEDLEADESGSVSLCLGEAMDEHVFGETSERWHRKGKEREKEKKKARLERALGSSAPAEGTVGLLPSLKASFQDIKSRAR